MSGALHGRSFVVRSPAAIAAVFAFAAVATALGAKTKVGAGALPVWPQPPDAPRIAYVSSFSKPAEAGAKVGGFNRFANWITGGAKGNEGFVRPFALALDEKDNLCVSDTGASAVCFFDRAKKTWSRWNKVGTVEFVSPVAVASRGGIIYVADSGRGSVVAFDTKGTLRFSTTNGMARPTGLAVTSDSVYVADAQLHHVVVLDLHGNVRTEFGRRGRAPGEFNFPTHVAIAPDGSVLVTDSLNNRVQVFEKDGRFRSSVGEIGDGPGHFSRPKGLAADPVGRLYVVDALFDNVQIFNPAGQLLLSVGESGIGPGQFWLPNGIAISRANEIFVADSYNRRIQVLKYIGQQ